MVRLLSKDPDSRQENIEALDRIIAKMRERKEVLEKTIAWAVNFRNNIVNGADLTQDILLLDDIDDTRLRSER
jgi:hypothetical protein